MISQAGTSQQQLQSSSQRGIPLEARADLTSRRIEYQGVAHWVVKDPVGLNYYRLRGEQYTVLNLLDGERSLEQIREELAREYPALRPTLPEVQHLITDLHQKGLLNSNRPGQGPVLLRKKVAKRKKQIFGVFKNLLYLRLPGWDPETSLTRMLPYVKWMWHPWVVGLLAAFVVTSWLLLAVQFDSFLQRLPSFHQFFGWPNLIYIWVTLGLAKVIHEFGHGLSCKYYGSECHQMGVMLLVFSPCLYCDVTDSWLLRSKWKRIIIAAAGMYIEVILSAIAIYVWWFTQPGLLHYLALNVFFVTTITTVIFNANPLMRFDGYYIASDWLEIPNLRIKADKLLRDTFSWYCLGIRQPHDPFMPETGHFWFITYSIAAATYRWFILFGITLFLYTVLKPYGLQSIGITLAIVSLASIVVNMIMNVYRIIAAPRNEPMSIPKATVTSLAVAGLITAALMIPIPWHLESPFLIEPYRVEHVFTNVAGHVHEVHVGPGDAVKQGQVLVTLSNPEMEDYLRKLLVDERTQEAEVTLYGALENVAQQTLAQERLESTREQLEDYRRQLADLTLVAPVDGRVVAPPRAPEPKLDTTRKRLTSWFGTPLDAKNAGSYLEPRTQVLSVAPNEQIQAILYIDQEDRHDVEVGEEVEIKFEHLADRTYAGTIVDISRGHSDYAPEMLSNKQGGRLPTYTDEGGQERLMSTAYQATVLIDEDTELLKSGMRGQARFLVDERSIGEWIWRYIRRTFHFRL